MFTHKNIQICIAALCLKSAATRSSDPDNIQITTNPTTMHDMNSFRTVAHRSHTHRRTGTLPIILMAAVLLMSNNTQAETCKVVMGGTNFTPPAKPSITAGTTATITVFGNFVDIAETVTASKNGVTVTKSNGVSGGFTPCNTNIRLSIVMASTVTPGEMTITLRGLGGSYTASFKVDVLAPPPPLCGTPEGQLSMMLANVVIGTPAAPTVSATNAQTFTFTSDLFKVAQSAATNTSCENAVTIEVFVATTAAALGNLDNLAANDGTDAFATPVGLTRKSITKTRSGNTFTCQFTVLRSDLTTGAHFYRVSKRIAKEGGEDPFVFSPSFTFTVVNKSPTASAGTDRTVTLPTTTTTLTGTGADDRGAVGFAWTQVTGAAATITSPTAATTTITGLALGTRTFRLRVTDSEGATTTDDVIVNVVAAADPTPTPDLRADGVDQLLYGGPNGSVGDGTFTYFKLPDNFCQSLPPFTSYVQDGTLGAAFTGTADKRIMRLKFPLPNMAIVYSNIGTAPTGAGFNVQVLKGATSTVLATIPAGALAAGASSSVLYTGRDTAIVYRFPGFDGTTDQRFCYVREELDHTFNPVFTKEKDGLTISIDPGAAVTTEPASKKANNKKLVAAGTTVIAHP